MRRSAGGKRSSLDYMKVLVCVMKICASLISMRLFVWQDRCRDIVVLEGKIKESEEQIENLKTESAMRKMEVEEQRQQLSDQSQQMSVLWDLGSKVRVSVAVPGLCVASLHPGILIRT